MVRTSARSSRRVKGQSLKVTALAGLGAVALLLWGRLLLKEVPRTAVADPEARQAARDTTAGPPLKRTGSPAAEDDASLPPITVVLSDPGPRDPFGFGAGLAGPRAAGDVSGPSEAGGHGLADTDQGRSDVRRLARGLQLQLIVLGDEPRAVINGRSLAVGEEFEGFTLVRIGERWVDLNFRGVRVRLLM